MDNKKLEKLSTNQENTWCPGCLNNKILLASQKAVAELASGGQIKLKNVTLISGIGCHAKIYDYFNINAFYSIHGRVLPTANGIKLANPELTVIGFGGDGDTYAEGTSHFIHSCRYNIDITMIVHNNQVFALTTGQATPTSEKGFKGGSTPEGNNERALNPIALALISGASFVARGYAMDTESLKDLIKQGILHKGFSFIDVLQPCLTFHNTIPYISKHIYYLNKSNHDSTDFRQALQKAQEWNYSLEEKARIPIGIFYQNEKIIQHSLPKKPYWKVKRRRNWQRILNEFR